MTTRAPASFFSESNAERLALSLGTLGARAKPLSLRGVEELSSLFTYEGTARVPSAELSGGQAGLRPQQFVGDVATITLRDNWGSERTVTGVVSDAQVELRDHGEATIHYVLRPLFFKLTLGRQARTFQDMDVIEIVKTVLDKGGVPVRLAVRDSYAKRAYTAQYNESDFEFVSRLLEEEGLFYWFDHAAESQLVIGDHSPSSDDLDDSGWKAGAPSGAGLIYRPELGLESDRAFVRELGARPRVQIGKVSLGSFDFQKPTFKVKAEQPNAGAPDAGLESYDAPGAGVEDPETLAHIARARAERAAAVAAMVKGSTPSVRFAPGRAFELSGHPFARLDGRYVLTKIEIDVESVGALAQGKPLETKFTALPSAVNFRPALVTAVPRHPGLHSGVVIGPPGEEVYPDSVGRVRLQQHWDREGTKDEKAGRWVRVSQRGTAGSMMLPRMGWNVLSMGVEGSVDQPMVLSRTFDGEHLPPYPLPENKTRVAYRTATTPGGGSHNEIRYEDSKGAEEMFINSTKDTEVLVNNIKGEVVHGFMVHEIGQDHTLTVGGTYDVHVDKDQVVKIGGNQSEKVAADRQKLVDGTESVTIGGSRSLKTGTNAEMAGESRSLKVGAAHISATLGEIKAQSKIVNQLVGGAMVKATPRKMTEDVSGGVKADTIVGMLPEKAGAAFGKLKSLPGASKVLAKVDEKLAKVGLSMQTVGVLKYEKGTQRKIETAETYKERIMMGLDYVTNAFIDKTKKFGFESNELVVKSKGITIKSDEEVVVKVGSTVLTVSKKEGIKLTSPEIQLTAAGDFEVQSKGDVKVN
ncbi:MAG: type VI secretion system tip protein TssI/VgrG [Polyangiaceae bacterium]